MNMQEKRKQAEQCLGKAVHVEIDRPIGYDHDGVIYPVNYGYIPGWTGGDGEAQDAYVLGVHAPLQEFDGIVIGVILRSDDLEDKIVVAPAGIEFHQAQIAQLVNFQERFFETRIVASLEKSCGVLPYRWINGQQEFLLVFEVHSKCWSLPKGHMEAGETEPETALRELLEETGLTAILDTGRSAMIEYPISSKARKQVVCFLGEVTGTPKARYGEIEGYQWVKAEDLQKYLMPDAVKACYTLLDKKE